MKGKWWIPIVVAVVAIVVLGGVFQSKQLRDKQVQTLAFSTWKEMQDRSNAVMTKVEGASLDPNGLGLVKAELKNHRDWLLEQRVELGRLLGHSTFYSTRLQTAVEKECELFKALYECTRDPSELQLDKAEDLAKDVHHHGEELQELISTATGAPDDNDVKDVINRIGQIQLAVGRVASPLSPDTSPGGVVVPSAPSSPVIAQLRQLFREYTGVRTSMNTVLKRFTGSDYDTSAWANFKSRSDSQFEISRRRSLLAQLENISPLDSYEAALIGQFREMLQYAIDTCEYSATRADFRDRSNVLSGLRSRLQRKLG